MKKIILSLLFSALLFGAREVDTLSFENFKNISGDVDIDITLGDTFSVVISADNGNIERLRASKDGESLVFKVKSGLTMNANFHAEIVMPALHNVKIEGSGDVNLKGRNIVDTMRISIEGSGDMEIEEFLADALLMEISGSGDIKIAGETSDISARITGSGDIDARNVYTEKAQVKLTGSGGMAFGEISEKLRVKIIGSGDVTFSGDPDIDRLIIGSGELRKR